MKEKLLKLAKKKGFVSNIIGKSVESIHTSKDFYYLWMCELKKWLRETNDIHVIMYLQDIEDDWDKPGIDVYSASIYEGKLKTDIECIYSGKTYLPYEEELENGLYHALKLIS